MVSNPFDETPVAIQMGENFEKQFDWELENYHVQVSHKPNMNQVIQQI